MPDSPQDPFTELAAGAAQLHEIYTAYIGAGFSEREALRIIIGIITAGISGGAQ